MAKVKEKKIREKFNWKKELKLAPGYIIIIAWVIFTFILLGWVLGASFSTTQDIFQGKALDYIKLLFKGDFGGFADSLHFENYAKAWTASNVATFFTNSLIFQGKALDYIKLLFKGDFGGFADSLHFENYAKAWTASNVATFFTNSLVFQGKALDYIKLLFKGDFGGFADSLHFENYAKAWTASNVATFFTNSLGYAIISCIALVLICAPAAYVLSRFDFIANKVLSLIFASSDETKSVAVGLYGMINSMRYTGDWAGMFAPVIDFRKL